MKVLMSAIKHFLPLVLATRKKDGWLSAIWVANFQEKLIVDSKQVVIYQMFYCLLLNMKSTYHVFSNISFVLRILEMQIKAANQTFIAASRDYIFKVDYRELLRLDCE